jgi:hypothetical protein
VYCNCICGPETAQCYSAGLWDGRSGVRVPAGDGNFSLRHSAQNGSGDHPPSCPMGTRGSFLGVKWSVSETDYSHPSSTEVKNAWRYNSTPPIHLHGVVLS